MKYCLAIKLQIVLIVMCLVMVYASKPSFAENKILATVGNDVITSSDLDRSYQIFLQANQMTPKAEDAHAIKSDLLSALINEKIIDQEARRLKVSVTSEDVDSAIESIESAQNLPKGELITRNEQLGLPVEDLKRQIYQKLLIEKILFEVVFPTHNSVIHDDELREIIEKDYPEFINIKALLWRYTDESITNRLNKIVLYKLCDVDYVTQAAGAPPKIIDSNLASLKNIRVKQMVLSVQEWPRLLVSQEGDQVIALILCDKKNIMPEGVLSEIREKLRNKKLEAYAQHYLNNLRKKRATDIHVSKDF